MRVPDARGWLAGKWMADWDYAPAETWAAPEDEYARWTANYSAQERGAHRHRPKQWRGPGVLLGFVPGREVAPDELHRIFHRTRFARVMDRLGYRRFRLWRVYADRGLAGVQAAIWLYEQTLTVECRDEMLPQYRVT